MKLLDKMMHAQAEAPDQQVVVLSQVLASEVNIGYEDILNTQVWVKAESLDCFSMASVVSPVAQLIVGQASSYGGMRLFGNACG